MHRTVSADIAFTMSPGQTQVSFMIAAAKVPGLKVDEELSVQLDGDEVEVVEVEAPHRGRIHLLEVDVEAQAAGQVQLSYRVQVAPDPQTEPDRTTIPSTGELLTYLRPSRYAESDRLLPTARQQFRGLDGLDLLNAVASFTFEQLSYVPGSSRFTDGAVEALLHRRGVCRDYAHLVVALLRGLDVPARVVAVYAPGLDPMDFHAVAEAWVEGRWHVVDSTRMAPRQSLLRIATGRDAADTAFMSTYGAGTRLGPQAVQARVDGDLPVDNHTGPVSLP